MKEQVFILLVFSVFILLAILSLALLSYFKWQNSKDIARRFTGVVVFEGLKTSAIKYGKMRSISGLTVRSKLLVNDQILAIMPERYSFFLFFTHLPVLFKRKHRLKPDKIVKSSWNAVVIHAPMATLPLGAARAEFLVETVDEIQKEALYEKLRNWPEAG